MEFQAVIPQDLSTTASPTFSTLTLTAPTQGAYKFDNIVPGVLKLQAQAGVQTHMRLVVPTGAGTRHAYFSVQGYGNDTTNYECMQFAWDGNAATYLLRTIVGGTGTNRPINIYAGSTNSYQIYVHTTGNVGIGKVPTVKLDVSGGALFDGNVAIQSDSYKIQLGGSLDLELFHDGSDSYITNATGTLTIATPSMFSFEALASDTDITFTFIATTHSGLLTWMENEDYFKFSDDLLLVTTEHVYFRDTAIHIASLDDGHLDLTADTSIDMNAPVVLKPGVAAAGGAPLKFTDGTSVLLTTPEAGAIEFNGARFYATETTQRRVISLSSDPKITDTVVANTTDETTVGTLTIAADTCCAGKVYRFSLFGKFSTDGTGDIITIRYKIAGVTILSYQYTGKKVTDAPCNSVFAVIIRTVGAAGTYAAYAYSHGDNTSFDPTPVTGSIDTTGDNAFSISAQWNTADAGNTLTCMGGYLEDLC